jgi:hypothetical protein
MVADGQKEGKAERDWKQRLGWLRELSGAASQGFEGAKTAEI